MKFLRDSIIPILAILILLILLVVALVLIYEQNGLMLPFAAEPDKAETASVFLPETIKNTIFPNWRI